MSDVSYLTRPELPKFHDLYRKMLRNDINEQLPGIALVESDPITEGEIRLLVGYASMLSTSSEAIDRAQAYEIATRLIEIEGTSSSSLVSVADIVLSRIGNFPGRSLLRDRYTSSPDTAPHAPYRLWLERATREIENSVTHFEGNEIALTDFQYRLFDALDQSSSVSVSAPTSAGKSFVMGLDLIRRLRKGDPSGPACVVYLVPTRALIREVSSKLREHLRKARLETVPVRSVPFPVDKEKAQQGAVYVLTQERLMSLLHSAHGKPWVTTLVVDEAQGIQDDSRGIILQSSIEAVLRFFPGAEIFFASPLIKNPEYLLSLFGRFQGEVSFVETLSPVSQNLILVSQVQNKKNRAKFEILLQNEHLDLGIRDLGFPFRGSKFTQQSDLARAVTRDDEATILFANGAAYTESLAEALINGQSEPTYLDPRIVEFIEFLRTEIHPEYPLIKMLPHGVAFHYGDMPAIVRARVEDLFKEGILRFVCCTSTLLQGVNLPARHIIIENPKRGSGNSMKRSDFLNLSGRAGRLLHEFHGNIWCLRPTEWEEQCYEGELLQDIRSAMSEAMADGGSTIQRLLSDEAKPDEVDMAEAAFGKVVNDFIATGNSLVNSEFRTEQNEAALALTEKKCQEIKITLPIEVLDANRAVRPDRLQSLYDYMKAVLDPTTLLPIKPGLTNSNQRMKEIIKVLQEKLANIHNESYIFYNVLACKWIYNAPLRKIIAEHIDYLRKEKYDTRKTSAIIRELLHTLEKDIRYRLVKYFIAYTSILALVLHERNNADAAEAIEPFHIYLECGASDRIALNLITLGFSRVTAIALHDKVAFPVDATPEECLAKLGQINIEHLNISKLCIREVRELVGR
ncbi:DEAD/DEAH box helicase [Rhodoferax sp.]|uniref:DEAD/DEAH box helicase n=1 Tax=Rhodoferax sp. TaxID=50421 RepID=UPI00284A2A80|nr:DEAD/DEAH box helicase [Rhodoferax sp.]MDR3367824.1 DEAD/DEAH box helicase [Rhodoferax sp.]